MKSELRSLREANLAKRILATIMDGALFIFTFFFLATLVFTPISNKVFDVQNIEAKELSYAVNSHLYVVEQQNDEGKYEIINPNELNTARFKVEELTRYKDKEVSFYLERVKYYYLNFKTGVDITYPEGKDIENYRAPNFDKEIKNDEGEYVMPKDYYTEAWFAQKISSITSPEEARNFAAQAIKDFSTSSYIKNIDKIIKKSQILIIVPSFVISFSIFLFVIPLIFKNGETLGKKTFQLGFVTKDGFDIKRRQIVIRQLALFLYVSIFTFAVGFEMLTCFATLSLGVAIYFVITAISKTKRSFLDCFTYVYLIDTKKSVWFHDEIEEEKFEQQVENNLSKLNEVPVENKHIIQIGNKIVDEKLKEEIKQEK